MSLPWSPEQREWLQALGHPLLVLAADGSIGDAAAKSGAVAESAPSQLVDRHTRTAAPDAADGSPAPASALHRALLKATGLTGPEAEQALRALGVDAASLRADPEAKRALWPRLRRLRRGTSG